MLMVDGVGHCTRGLSAEVCTSGEHVYHDAILRITNGLDRRAQWAMRANCDHVGPNDVARRLRALLMRFPSCQAFFRKRKKQLATVHVCLAPGWPVVSSDEMVCGYLLLRHAFAARG